MPLTKKPNYIKEPTDLQCGQAVLAMLSDKSVEDIIAIVGTERETTLKQMFLALDTLGIEYNTNRIEKGDEQRSSYHDCMTREL